MLIYIQLYEDVADFWGYFITKIKITIQVHYIFDTSEVIIELLVTLLNNENFISKVNKFINSNFIPKSQFIIFNTDPNVSLFGF